MPPYAFRHIYIVIVDRPEFSYNSRNTGFSQVVATATPPVAHDTGRSALDLRRARESFAFFLFEVSAHSLGAQPDISRQRRKLLHQTMLYHDFDAYGYARRQVKA